MRQTAKVTLFLRLVHASQEANSTKNTPSSHVFYTSIEKALKIHKT